MKITVETGGEPNPQPQALKAFVQRNKKRIIIAGAAIVALVVVVFVGAQIAGTSKDASDFNKIEQCAKEQGVKVGDDSGLAFDIRANCRVKVENGVYP